MRTYFPKKGDIEPRWFVIDAEGQVLGRIIRQKRPQCLPELPWDADEGRPALAFPAQFF